MIRLISGATICGMERRSFKKKSGETSNCYNLHFQYPLSGEKDDGLGCGVCYASIDYVNRHSLSVGAPVLIAVSGFGKDTRFELAE